MPTRIHFCSRLAGLLMLDTSARLTPKKAELAWQMPFELGNGIACWMDSEARYRYTIRNGLAYLYTDGHGRDVPGRFVILRQDTGQIVAQHVNQGQDINCIGGSWYLDRRQGHHALGCRAWPEARRPTPLAAVADRRRSDTPTARRAGQERIYQRLRSAHGIPHCGRPPAGAQRGWTSNLLRPPRSLRLGKGARLVRFGAGAAVTATVAIGHLR